MELEIWRERKIWCWKRWNWIHSTNFDLVIFEFLKVWYILNPQHWQAYMEAMQSQWSWLIQLTVCLEQHVKFKALYHQFFKDCKTCEEDIDRQLEMLSSRYSQEHLDSDEAKQRVKELQELQKHLTSLQHHIEGLVHRSGEVPPLQLRSSRVQSPVRVQCLCTYRQPEVKTFIVSLYQS